jgi:DNA-binding MarR family transcriptional regulator
MSKDVRVRDLDAIRAVLSGPGTVASDGAPAVDRAERAAVDPTPELDALEHRAWRGFLLAHARVARRLEADLVARDDMQLAEFDVLMQLAMADGQRLRMNELADRVVLSRAGITRLVDRLVADGLVERLKCASDARGAFAVLTDGGHARLGETRPAHFAAVRRNFLEAFTRPELEALADLLDRPFPLD